MTAMLVILIMLTMVTMVTSTRITTVMSTTVTRTTVVAAIISRVIWIGPHKILTLIYSQNLSIIDKCKHHLCELTMKMRIRLYLLWSPTVKSRTIET